MIRLLLAFFLLCLGAFALEPSEVAVVYNADSRLSRECAELYCNLRGIPRVQCLPLHGVGKGDISRADFDLRIRMELLMQGRDLGLMWPSGPKQGQKSIWAMVLMPDLPLRVKEEPVNGKLKGGPTPHNAASVDSELMLLGADYPLEGPGRNPFFGKELRLDVGRPPVMAVCRIDGPDEETIRRMMTDPIRVEKTGLWGWVVVDQGGPYQEGDAWLEKVAELAKAQGQPLFYDTSRETLAEAFPLMQQTAVYFGWYAHPANGPFRPEAAGDFRFAPGAIACHLHSFSATSVKDAHIWVGALLKRGASVTAGNVAEPLLGTCLYYGIFYERLLAGYTVAEAALMATPVVSWQGVILGDPLYRPFPASPPRLSPINPFVQWRELCRRSSGRMKEMRNAVEQKMGENHGGLFAEMYAWHCAENKRLDAAAEYFRTAFERYGTLRDKTRTMLLMVTTQAASGNRKRAELTIREWLASGADSPYAPAIRKTANALLGPPSSPPAAGGKSKAASGGNATEKDAPGKGKSRR